MGMCHVCTHTQRPEKGARSHGAGVIGSCESQQGCGKPNSGPLQELYVF